MDIGKITIFSQTEVMGNMEYSAYTADIPFFIFVFAFLCFSTAIYIVFKMSKNK